MVDAVTYTGLSCQIDHHSWTVLLKYFRHQCLIRKVPPYEYMLYPAVFSNLFNLRKPPLLECDLIIIVHVVEGEDGTPVELL